MRCKFLAPSFLFLFPSFFFVFLRLHADLGSPPPPPSPLLNRTIRFPFRNSSKDNDSAGVNSGDAGGADTMLDASPSALPEFGMDSQEPAVSAADEDATGGNLISVRRSARGHGDGTIDNLRVALPEFAAACMTALHAFEEQSTSPASTASAQPPELCARIIKQLWKSVDEFITSIVDQAESRIAFAEGMSQTSISELDNWIGSIVAAETASVGAMRKSMLTAISSVFENDVDEDSPAMHIAMRYGVNVKDDGPARDVFDTRCKDSTLRAPPKLSPVDGKPSSDDSVVAGRGDGRLEFAGQESGQELGSCAASHVCGCPVQAGLGGPARRVVVIAVAVEVRTARAAL